MGLSGGLVRRVFLKSRSSSSSIRNGNERNIGVDKSRWCSVRHYLCGDEFNSVPAEDDLSSVKGSEATAMQHAIETSGDEESPPVVKLEEHEEPSMKEGNSPAKLLSQEDAAIFIQSAFRGFMARRSYEEVRKSCEGDHIEGSENPSGASVAASTEAQLGDSFENLSLQEKSVIIQHKVQHKAQTQLYRVKEKWDNSTVSSNVLKLKIQNRLEATTRRERALAYAFSQQLRTCPAKKKSTRSDSKETNMGWSWLERWMATRMPENSLAEDCLNKHFDPISTYQRSAIVKKKFDIAIEEKESCGSNDVSVNFDGSTTPSQTPRDGYRPVKSRMKTTRSMLRRRTAPDYHYKTRSSKVSKRDSLKEVEKEKSCKQVQPKNKVELNAEVSQVPSDYWMNSCV